jgi:hypothetical protein
MEPTHPAEPQGEPPERHVEEDDARYPGHGDPDAARERVGLDRPREPEPDDPPAA